MLSEKLKELSIIEQPLSYPVNGLSKESMLGFIITDFDSEKFICYEQVCAFIYSGKLAKKYSSELFKSFKKDLNLSPAVFKYPRDADQFSKTLNLKAINVYPSFLKSIAPYYIFYRSNGEFKIEEIFYSTHSEKKFNLIKTLGDEKMAKGQKDKGSKKVIYDHYIFSSKIAAEYYLAKMNGEIITENKNNKNNFNYYETLESF